MAPYTSYDIDAWLADNDPNWGDDPNRPIEPNPGSELDPANFIGRRRETRQAYQMLLSGHNLLLSDPRRLGKTYWMIKLAEQMEKLEQFHVVRIDYQGVTSIEQFLTVTVKSLVGSQAAPRRFVQYAKGLFNNVDITVAKGPVTLKRAAAGADPLDHLERLFRKLDQEIQQIKTVPYVIAMDEVPDAILSIIDNGKPVDGRNVLHRLRNLRESMPHIRWIVAGSVGFHHVLTACEETSAPLNNLDNFAFGPLDPAGSETLVGRLCRGIDRDIDRDAVPALCELTDGIPYLIQSLCDQMRWAGGHGTITATEVRDQFEAFLDDRGQSHAVTHFVTRIDKYYHKDDAALAYQILSWTAADPAGWRSLADLPAEVQQAPRYRPVLKNLIDDHYLVTRNRDREVTWRYEVIRVIYRRQQMEN